MNNPVFTISMAVTSVFGMLFAVIAFNIASDNAVTAARIEKGYQKCVYANPRNTDSKLISVWQKECQPLVIKAKEKKDGN